MKKFLLLDMDNTLVDTEGLILPVFLDILKDKYDIDLSQETFFELFLGKSEKVLYDAIGQHFNTELDREWLLQAQRTANENALNERGIQLAEGLIPCLHELKDEGFSLGIVSNSTLKDIEAKLDNLIGDSDKTLLTLVDDNLFSCNHKQKPDPDGYLRAKKAMSISENDLCFTVEDSGSGVKAAIDASIPVFGYTGFALNPDKTADKLRTQGCINVFHAWSKFAEMLYSHTKN